MWWAKSEAAAQVWLGAGRVAWCIPGRDALVAEAPSLDDGLAQLSQWCGETSDKGSIRVWLGGDLCRLACVPAIAGARNRGDAESAALSWMRSQGRLPPGWTATLAESAAGAAWWRVAVVPERLVQRLTLTLKGHASSARPWWSWALQQRAARGQADDRLICAYDGAALVTCSWDESGAVATAETAGPIENLSAARRLLRRRVVQGGDVVRPICVRIDWPQDGLLGASKDNSSAFLLAPLLRWGDDF